MHGVHDFKIVNMFVVCEICCESQLRNLMMIFLIKSYDIYRKLYCGYDCNNTLYTFDFFEHVKNSIKSKCFFKKIKLVHNRKIVYFIKFSLPDHNTIAHSLSFSIYIMSRMDGTLCKHKIKANNNDTHGILLSSDVTSEMRVIEIRQM